jgi:hypothetical protein
VPNGEEDEPSSEQQRQHVAEGRQCEHHGHAGANGERPLFSFLKFKQAS